MANYVDGFVIPIPTEKVNDYRALAERARDLWTEHGAISYREFVLEDASAEHCDSFPRLAATTESETVVFAWIGYESRAHRDEVNAKVMADPRMQAMMEEPMVFNCQRMAYGGFQALV